MSLEPLSRQYALTLRRPNPMWIPSIVDLHAIEDILFPATTSDGRPYFYGEIDCWESRIHIGVRNIRVLATMNDLRPRKAVLSLHRETTITNKRCIDIEGNSLSVLEGDREGVPFRQYFDGFSFKKWNKMGHVAAACVDYDAKEIWLQDPQGIAVKPVIRKEFEEAFPDYKLKDLMIWQQRDAHSCSILTLYNKECFFRGEIPEANVDVTALRERYLTILEEHERQMGMKPKENRYYTAPVYKLRHTPV